MIVIISVFAMFIVVFGFFIWSELKSQKESRIRHEKYMAKQNEEHRRIVNRINDIKLSNSCSRINFERRYFVASIGS